MRLAIVALGYLVTGSLAVKPQEVLALMKKQAIRTAGTGHTGNAYPDTTHMAPVQGLNTWINRNGWTMGFFPGFLWQLYNVTEDANLKALAINWTEGVKPEVNNTHTHDLGFMVYDSLGQGWELGGMQQYKDLLLTAAHSLATRYSPAVQAIKGLDDNHNCRLWPTYTCNFTVMIDQMPSLELLFFSANNGGPGSHREMAIKHAEKTSKFHLRADGSSFNVVDFDPATGKVSKQCTTLGYRDDSTFTRGQSWCLYGFTQTFRYTAEKKFLDAAVKCAEFFIKANTMHDHVPLWDFSWDGPQTSYYRDSSAAAVAASGLVELASYVPHAQREQYMGLARNMVQSLMDSYLGKFEETQGVLLHATGIGAYPDPSGDSGDSNGRFAGANVDVSLPYADYFLLEAMRRLHMF